MTLLHFLEISRSSTPNTRSEPPDTPGELAICVGQKISEHQTEGAALAHDQKPWHKTNRQHGHHGRAELVMGL